MSNTQHIQHDEGQEEFDTDDQQPQQRSSGGDDIEATARRLGWRPVEEYKGDPDKWVDASEYIRQADEDVPRLRHVNKTLERKLAKMETGVAEILEHQKRQLKQTRDDAYRDAEAVIEARYKQAVAAGDVEGADKAWKAKDALDKQAMQPVVKTSDEVQLSDDDMDTLKDWMSNNDWFSEDPVMADYARKYERNLTTKGVSLNERLKRTTEYIQRKFPQEFEDMGNRNDSNDEETPAPQARSMSRGSSRSGVRTPPKKAQPGTYEALTAEGRAACDRFVSMNGGKKEAKAEWLRFATSDLFIA